MLERVSIEWVWLQQRLNEIIAEVNANCPLASATIAIDHTPAGSVIKATPRGGGGGDGPTPTPDGDQAGWQQIGIMDASCNQYYMWVWGGPLK